MVDRDDDLKIGIRTSAITFGRHDVAAVMLCYLLSLVLIGAYSMKGPFWALASGWLSSSTAAAGLAAIGALANLIGGGVMVNVYGAIHGATHSHALAVLPLATLCAISGLLVLVMGRKAARARAEAQAATANANAS